MKRVYLFSDGSSLGNPGPGGYCALLRYGKHEKIIKVNEVAFDDLCLVLLIDLCYLFVIWKFCFLGNNLR